MKKNELILIITTSFIAPLLVGILINELYMERMAFDYKINTLETKEIENKLKFSVITFTNSGNKSIPIKAYERDVRILIENSKVIDCKVSEESLKYLDIKITYDSSNVFIKPLLLNPKEKFSLYLMTQGENPNIQVIARIDGISKHTGKFDINLDNYFILRYLTIHLSVFAGILLLLVYTKLRQDFKNRSVIKKLSSVIVTIPIILVRYCSVFLLTQSFGFSIFKFVGIYIAAIIMSWSLLISFQGSGTFNIDKDQRFKRKA